MKSLRQRVLAPFRTLGWKLTLSYTLVTVAALLVVELALMITGMSIVQNPNFFPRLATEVLVANASQAAPYLDETPPDVNGLQSWLFNVAVNGLNADSSGGSGQLTPGTFSEGDSQIFILDTQQKTLAAIPENATPPPWPEATHVIAVALSGINEPERLFQINEDRRTALAAPIIDSNGQVLGIILITATMFSASTQETFNQLPPLLAWSAVFFTIAAGVVGTIFGLITSRGLVKRLQAVSRAADAWSQGDFSITIPDRVSDELGQLATRLNQMSEQLKTLLQTRQELASLEERNRLARDLHDSVKQQVFATAMQVGAARELLNDNPQAAETHLSEAERLARLAQQELTVLIRELRPAALEGRGLLTALRDYLATWSQQCDIEYGLRVQGERALPLNVEQALYRVTQEALSNIARHSQATRVDIHLSWQEDRIRLTIRDNGCGFNPESAANKGVGLQSMHERIEALGGSLTVTTRRNENARDGEEALAGTRIEITCPI
ncbi:MAG: histidine kinase [Chloroflexota bacterium]